MVVAKNAGNWTCEDNGDTWVLYDETGTLDKVVYKDQEPNFLRALILKWDWEEVRND